MPARYIFTNQNTVHCGLHDGYLGTMSLHPRCQHDLAASETCASEAHLLPPWFRISAFQRRELLHQTDGYIRGFCKGELFCQRLV